MKRALSIVILGLALGTAVTARFQNAVAQPENWQIGLLLCLSGACANDGTEAMRGATIAAEELNGKGGVLGKRIELIAQDTSEAVSGLKAISAYRDLRLNRRIRYYIGPSWTPAGLALAPLVAADKDVLMASPSLGAAQFHLAGDNIFNVRGTDEVASRREARYAYAKGMRRAAILSSQQPWESQQAEFFEDEFKKLGGQIVVREEPLPTVTDIKSEMLRITRSEPDVVFLASIILMGQAARELRGLQYQGMRIGSNVDHMRIAESAGALDGTVFFSFQKPAGEFRKQFMTRYGEEPQPAAAVAYDTLYAFAKAVEESASFELHRAQQAILKLDFEGASGRIHFDAEGCARREPQGWQVAGASYVPLGDSSEAGAPSLSY